LDSGDTEEAVKTIEKALEVNPVHLKFRALKAAAMFLRDQEDDMKRLQDEALAYNPNYSGVYRIPGKVASRHYRFQEGAEFQKKALEIDENDHRARTYYALDILRLGKDEEGKAELDKAFKADPFNVQVFNLLELMDTLATFDVIEAGPFQIKIPKHESLILKDEVISLLQEAFEKYQHKYNIELETPVHIQIFDNHDDFMVRSVGLPGSVGFMGICFGKLVTMDSPSAREKRSMNWRSVLWHEFVHVITLQKTKNRMPRWLSEGISVYEETEYSPAFGQKLEVSYKPLITMDALPGMMDLELMFTQPKTSQHIQLGYFMAGEFVRYYVDEYGMDSLNQSLDKMAVGSKASDALASAALVDVEDVDQGFHDYLKIRLRMLDHIPAVPEKPEEEIPLLEMIRTQTEQHESCKRFMSSS